MKNKDSKARMQMIFGILLFAFIFMAELYAIVNFPKMFIAVSYTHLDVYKRQCMGSRTRTHIFMCRHSENPAILQRTGKIKPGH